MLAATLAEPKTRWTLSMHHDGDRVRRRYRVLLVDDQPEALAFMRRLLEVDSAFTIAAAALGGHDALAQLQEAAPHVAVVDVDMPGLNGFATARALRAADPGLQIVLVSASHEAEYESIANAAGAVGFITKRTLSADVLASLLEGS